MYEGITDLIMLGQWVKLASGDPLMESTTAPNCYNVTLTGKCTFPGRTEANTGDEKAAQIRITPGFVRLRLGQITLDKLNSYLLIM